jgi:hypothetical protein
MKKMIFRSLLGLGLVALLVSPAAAQGRRFGRFGGNPAFLLENASVQKELKLDDKQIEKAKELAEKTGEKMRENFESVQDLEGEERFKKMQELNRGVNESALKEAAAILKPEQVDRLKQIAYQERGASALTEPDVQKKLDLTDSQKTEIQSLVQESFGEMRSIFQDNQGDWEAITSKLAELRKQTRSKAESKLKDEQQKTWKEMLGSPFEVKWEPPSN